MSTSPLPDAAPTEPVWLPTERKCPFDPPNALGELRDSRPLTRLRFPDGHMGWLVTSHELVRAVLGDRRFSQVPGGQPKLQAVRAQVFADAIQQDTTFPDNIRALVERYRQQGRLTEAFWDVEVLQALREQTLATLPYLDLDPPAHTRLRRILAGHFTVRRVREYRPYIEQIVSDRLDEMERMGPPADLVKVFAEPIPSLLTCALFGIPESERGEFERLTEVMTSPSSAGDDVLQANADYRAFARELVERKRAQPAEDMLGALVHSGELTDEELVGLVVILVRASHVSTSTTMTFAVATLLRDRNLWDTLRTEEAPTGDVVEELLRYTSVAQAPDIRTALEDIELGGTVIKANETVVVSLPAANRDPKVFTQPDRVDVTRSATKHLTFGFGIHQCLGQNLARLELQIALTGLARRFPKLDLAVPEADILWLGADGNNYGPKALPVTW
ncbi:cytochrome P450 [Nocardia sp. NPDC059239]|uniref:cytochrome P450 n=1 Tax=Nocardia sp. NPDC059239 TaxID=3346785 RepID=UPI00367A2A0D